MKKDILITFILFILILIVQFIDFRNAEIYTEKRVTTLFINKFQYVSFAIDSILNNEISVKNNTDLKRLFKSYFNPSLERNDLQDFFDLNPNTFNIDIYSFFGNQINIYFLNKQPDFKNISIFDHFSKGVSISVYFYKDKKNNKFIFFIKDRLGKIYGKSDEATKKKYIFTNGGYLKL